MPRNALNTASNTSLQIYKINNQFYLSFPSTGFNSFFVIFISIISFQEKRAKENYLMDVTHESKEV